MNIELTAIGAQFRLSGAAHRKRHLSQAKTILITVKQVYHVLAGLYRRSFFEETKLMKAVTASPADCYFCSAMPEKLRILSVSIKSVEGSPCSPSI